MRIFFQLFIVNSLMVQLVNTHFAGGVDTPHPTLPQRGRSFTLNLLPLGGRQERWWYDNSHMHNFSVFVIKECEVARSGFFNETQDFSLLGLLPGIPF